VSRLRTEAILLRTVDLGESDRIVHLLVPDEGRLAAMAKGARRSVKRFPGTLDLFNHLSVEVNRRCGLAYLEKATLVSPFAGLRVLPSRFGLACQLLELFARLAPEGGAAPDMKRLFRFALAALGALEHAHPDARLRLLFELRTLDALGLRPELRHCVRCGSELQGPDRARFHVADGGVVCLPCVSEPEALLELGLGTLRVLEQALRFDLDALDRINLSPRGMREAATAIHRFQRFHVGLELRSAQFLDQILPTVARESA